MNSIPTTKTSFAPHWTAAEDVILLQSVVSNSAHLRLEAPKRPLAYNTCMSSHATAELVGLFYKHSPGSSELRSIFSIKKRFYHLIGRYLEYMQGRNHLYLAPAAVPLLRRILSDRQKVWGLDPQVLLKNVPQRRGVQHQIYPIQRTATLAPSAQASNATTLLHRNEPQSYRNFAHTHADQTIHTTSQETPNLYNGCSASPPNAPNMQSPRKRQRTLFYANQLHFDLNENSPHVEHARPLQVASTMPNALIPTHFPQPPTKLHAVSVPSQNMTQNGDNSLDHNARTTSDLVQHDQYETNLGNASTNNRVTNVSTSQWFPTHSDLLVDVGSVGGTPALQQKVGMAEHDSDGGQGKGNTQAKGTPVLNTKEGMTSVRDMTPANLQSLECASQYGGEENDHTTCSSHAQERMPWTMQNVENSRENELRAAYEEFEKGDARLRSVYVKERREMKQKYEHEENMLDAEIERLERRTRKKEFENQVEVRQLKVSFEKEDQEFLSRYVCLVNKESC